MATSPSPVVAFINRWLPGLRFPWLFAILAGLLALDLVVPDPIPFIDEAVLTVLTILAASWRSGSDDERPPPRDITPPEESEESTRDSG